MNKWTSHFSFLGCCLFLIFVSVFWLELYTCVFWLCLRSWDNLFNFEWSDPFYTDHTPEAFLISSNETESFEGHSIWLIYFVGVQELIGWDPLGECANKLPEVLIVLVGMAVGLSGCSLDGTISCWLVDLTWRCTGQSCGNQLRQVIIGITVFLECLPYLVLFCYIIHVICKCWHMCAGGRAENCDSKCEELHWIEFRFEFFIYLIINCIACLLNHLKLIN